MKPILLLLAMALPASASVTSFTWFNGTNDAGVVITSSSEQVGADTILTVSNESTLSSAIVTGIWFEGGTIPAFIPSDAEVVFSFDDKANLPGGNNIAWSNGNAFIADAPPTKNGLSVGESASFRFVGAKDDEVNASRIGLHVQAINGSSGSWVSQTVPEPSCVLLSVFSLGLYVKRQRAIKP